MNLRFNLQQESFEGALCASVDPELFFPTRGSEKDATKAKAICKECYCLNECRDYALKRPALNYGIWGGLSPRERMKIRQLFNVEIIEEEDEEYGEATG